MQQKIYLHHFPLGTILYFVLREGESETKNRADGKLTAEAAGKNFLYAPECGGVEIIHVPPRKETTGQRAVVSRDAELRAEKDP